MKTSLEGLAFFIAEEAIVLSTYRDSGGVPTIGCGHTAMAGPPRPVPGLRIDYQAALDLLVADISRYEDDVTRAVKIPLTQHQFDALVSFHYNTGAIGTGTVDDLLNAERFVKAMDKLEEYRRDDGKIVPGLEARRGRERALFERGIYGSSPAKLYQRYPGVAALVPRATLLADLRRATTLPQDGDAAPLPSTPRRAEPGPSTEKPRMNSNLFHNIANVLIAVLAMLTAGLLATGCTQAVTGVLECSASWIDPVYTGMAIAALSGLKMIVNVARDGFGGLVKPQPPVEK